MLNRDPRLDALDSADDFDIPAHRDDFEDALDSLSAASSLEEANALLEDDDQLPDTSHIFTLTSLIDSSAAQAAAERMYAGTQNGLRFFSELNRALPRSQADRMPRETEILEDTLEPGMY